MPRTIAFPSPDLPAPPHVAVTVPDDWEALIVPGVQIAVAEPEGRGAFRANVVVSIQRLPGATDLSDLAEVLEHRRAELEQLEDLGTGALEVRGRTWLASEYAYASGEAGMVVQASRSTIVRNGPVADAVEIVGSCGADRADALIATIRGIQDSASILVQSVGDATSRTGDPAAADAL